jgi:hypothetical protein
MVGPRREQMKKNYVVIVRDHSGSMASIRDAAMHDYNMNVVALKEASSAENLDTIVSTVRFGVGFSGVEREIVNSNVKVLKELKSYDAVGMTPLFDAVGEAISILRSVPDADDPEVSFLVMVISDGLENSSRNWNGRTIKEMMLKLTGTDRWTFTFRVPNGYSKELVKLGIPSGNILEWEQSEEGMRKSTEITTQSVRNHYRSLASGETSSKTFYTDLSGVKPQTVKAKLVDISKEVKLWKTDENDEAIRTFCERKSKKPFLKGAAFYQLTKTEKKVQDYKAIIIRDKKTGAFYSGVEARNLLGLPHTGEVKIVPGNHGNYDVFVQSTSVNRKLKEGTQVIYWPKVGEAYTEGPSAKR